MKKIKSLSVLLTVILVSGLALISCTSTTEPNQLTKAEIEDGWVLMYDGVSSQGWRGVNQDAFPESGWVLENGTLQCQASGRGEAGGRGGDILYDKKFANYHLKLEWMIDSGGNSGIIYMAQEIEGQPMWQTGPEMQVLDNERHPDAKLGVDGNRMAGSLYDLIPAKPQNANPPMEWNSAEIMVFDGTVVHIQNGVTVVEYHLWTDEWNEMVAASKFVNFNPDWANIAREGYITLQDHGNNVWYRNIKIKEL